MPQNLAFLLLASALELLRGSLFLAIIAFFFCLAGKALHSRLSKRFKISWLQATALSTYIVMFVVVAFLYFFPFVLGSLGLQQGKIPDFFQISVLEAIEAFIVAIARVAVVSIIFSAFLLPLEFLGSFVKDSIEERFKAHALLSLFAGVFVSTLVASFIVIFLLPEIVPALVYLLYYWHA